MMAKQYLAHPPDKHTMPAAADAEQLASLVSLALPLLPPPDESTFNLYLKLSAASGELPLHLRLLRLIELAPARA